LKYWVSREIFLNCRCDTSANPLALDHFKERPVMSAKSFNFLIRVFLILICHALIAFGQSKQIEKLRGTLVVAVPINDGLVACADKRLYNADAGTATDDFVKIRKAGTRALFAATNTVGFYDRKSRKMAFDAFEITQNYTNANPFAPTKKFWDGLKQDIREKLVTYLSGQDYANWPETDKANKGLLFNLVFYSVSDGRAHSHTLKVFYEKKKTPVIFIPEPVSEEVRFPKLSGKGREVMTYFAQNPAAGLDPAIVKFDESRFDLKATSREDAIEFAQKLFQITSTAVPGAQVSPTFDCALLDFASGFKIID